MKSDLPPTFAYPSAMRIGPTYEAITVLVTRSTSHSPTLFGGRCYSRLRWELPSWKNVSSGYCNRQPRLMSCKRKPLPYSISVPEETEPECRNLQPLAYVGRIVNASPSSLVSVLVSIPSRAGRSHLSECNDGAEEVVYLL